MATPSSDGVTPRGGPNWGPFDRLNYVRIICITYKIEQIVT
jgi:hypothetical protein